MNVVLEDLEEECFEDDIRELWHNMVRENAVKMEEIRCNGLTWFIL
jgi:hypothetical protein